MSTAGLLLRKNIVHYSPLQIVGVTNALTALLAKQAGCKAIYLSGAGIANAEYALPDLGLISLNDVMDAAEKITMASDLPLLVDVDVGFGSLLNIRRTFRILSRLGVAGAHIEDQVEAKRCGHRDKKRLISQKQMCKRIQAALEGRNEDSFLVMARTDALAVEGEQRTLERALAYEAAGAEALFLEAATSLAQYQLFTDALRIPVLANMTEFGKTPLFKKEALAQVGVSMILYPLSGFRAMNAAALKVYSTIATLGTQQSIISSMQTREALYALLGYEQAESELEHYLEEGKENHGRET